MKIIAGNMHFQKLNEAIRDSREDDILLVNCEGQRYIASGMSQKRIVIENGVPGNALGAYLNGGRIEVKGNAQDATGDTMNGGEIIIHGSSGDATGYAMRGGRIFVRGNAGYRAGIHMKAYQEQQPLLVIGGCAGSFLGEYQAGGTIIVLGLGCDQEIPVGGMCGTGMHGGRMFIRCERLPDDLPEQIVAERANEEDMASIDNDLDEFCHEFGTDKKEICAGNFYVLRPNSKNPYKALYTYNP